MNAVLELQPHDRTARLDVANRLAWLADAKKANGEFSGALQSRLAQERIISALVGENPDDMGLKEIWLKTELMLAEALALNGLHAKAQTRLAGSKKIHQRLSRHDPANRQWDGWQRKIAEIEQVVNQR